MVKKKRKPRHVPCPAVQLSSELDNLISSKVPSGILVTADTRKKYFEELYDIFLQTKWQDLEPYEKVIFFGRWFYAASDEYLIAYQRQKFIEQYPDEHASLMAKVFYNSPIVKPLLKLTTKSVTKDANATKKLLLRQCMDISKKERVDEELNSGSPAFWIDLPYSKKNRDAYLTFKKGQVKFSPINTEQQEIRHKTYIIEGKTCRLKNYLKAISIDIRFPQEIILCKIKPIIEQARKDYFQQNPDEKPIFNKEMTDGRSDTYHFGEWDRYLKIYLLKQQKKTNRELGEQFYPPNADPKRQVLNDNKKAIKLIQNSVSNNFPGKY